MSWKEKIFGELDRIDNESLLSDGTALIEKEIRRFAEEVKKELEYPEQVDYVLGKFFK